MKTSKLLAGLLLVSALPASHLCAVPFTGNYFQNFNSMGASGTTPPNGWLLYVGNTGTTNVSWTTTIPANGADSVSSMGLVTGALTATNAPTTNNNNGFNAGAPGDASNRLLATSPTSFSGSALQLELTNGTALPLSEISLSYDLRRFTSVATAGELPGYNIFLSLDGTTWTNVASLNPTLAGPGGVIVPNTAGVTTVSPTTIALTSAWNPGNNLLIRFVDDNAQQTSPDQIIGVDNVQVVPEPATGILALAGLVGLAWRRQRVSVTTRRM